MKEISNIIFDFGGMLLDLDRESVVSGFDRLGYPQAENLIDSYNPKGIFGELEKGTIRPQELYSYISEKIGREIPGEEIDRILDRFIVGLQPYKLELVDRLREKYQVYALSNTNAIMAPRFDRKWFSQSGKRMSDYFDKMYLSYEMGMLKPSPEIFEAVIRDSGIIPEQTLFIDDSQANIETSMKFGFQVYKPSPGEDLRPVLEPLL